MPEPGVWDAFFAPDAALDRLGLHPGVRDALDVGCGYGTFAVPAARAIRGVVHAFDIDPAMVEATAGRARRAGLTNVRAAVRDVVDRGSGLPDGAVGFIMLFNILHCEDPVGLLAEARRVGTRGATVAVMHWRPDPSTPRGPSMAIRPRPEDLARWADAAGLRPATAAEGVIDLPPFHFGLRFVAKP